MVCLRGTLEVRSFSVSVCYVDEFRQFLVTWSGAVKGVSHYLRLASSFESV